MLKVLFFTFFAVVNVANAESISIGDFTCSSVASKPGKFCDYYVCKSPNGYGLGELAVTNGFKNSFFVTPVTAEKDGGASFASWVVGLYDSYGVMKKELITAKGSDTPQTVLPEKYKDNFLTYRMYRGGSKMRAKEIAANCNSEELSSLVSKLDKRSDEIFNDLKNRDYVKVVDVINQSAVVSRMAPRDSLSADYCDIGNSTLASKAAIQKIKGTEFEEPNGKVLTEKEAQALFDEIKNMKDLPWEYTPDGCYARAQIAAERIQKKGIAVGKAWYFGDSLWPNNMKKKDLDGWSYHVVPFVYVAGADGKIRRMVLDPASQSQPIESYDFATKLTTEKNPQILKTRWAGGVAQSGLPMIQMMFTSAEYYTPDKISAANSDESRENAEKTNKQIRDYLEKQKEKDPFDLSK